MRNAYWIKHTHLFRANDYKCSACNALYDDPYDICPSCGSLMGSPISDTSWIDEMADYDSMFGDDDD